MRLTGEVWRLYQGEQLIAELIVTDYDFPWLNARLEAKAGFEALRPLFDEEAGLIDGVEDHTDAWEAAYNRIREAVSLAAPDGRRVPEFLLHIEGEDAWWRWSDEPFDDDGAGGSAS
jgi:hypothetical protein